MSKPTRIHFALTHLADVKDRLAFVETHQTEMIEAGDLQVNLEEIQEKIAKAIKYIETEHPTDETNTFHCWKCGTQHTVGHLNWENVGCDNCGTEIANPFKYGEGE